MRILTQSVSGNCCPKAPYSVFLPYNFNKTNKFPVIFEIPQTSYCDTNMILGYGLCKGFDYIWVCAPYVDETGEIPPGYWGDDPLTTVEYWLNILDDLNLRFQIDTKKIVIAGFSLGAYAASSFGNYNDIISSKWAAYFSNSHFDGCCLTCPGDPNERIERIKNRKILIAVGENDGGKSCSYNTYLNLKSRNFSVTYIEIPNYIHSPNWILDQSESAEKARFWLQSLFSENIL